MVMWNNILLILPVVVPVLAGLLAGCIKSRSARNALTGASLVINALLVALGLHRKEALTEHFRKLETIWDTYEIYLEEEGHHA